jgi:hypothetical protein
VFTPNEQTRAAPQRPFPFADPRLVRIPATLNHSCINSKCAPGSLLSAQYAGPRPSRMLRTTEVCSFTTEVCSFFFQGRAIWISRTGTRLISPLR